MSDKKPITVVLENNKIIIELNSKEDCEVLEGCLNSDAYRCYDYIKKSVKEISVLVDAKKKQFIIENNMGEGI